MKTFYTLIKISPNTMAGDSIAIGLLLRNDDKFWVRFSETKKGIAKKLLENNAEVVDFISKQIIKNVDDLNKELSSSQIKFFDFKKIITSEKISHLNIYSNGLLRFSEPSLINDDFNEAKFIKLFQLLVDKTYEKVKPEIDHTDSAIHNIVENKLIKRVSSLVYTNMEFTPDKLAGLYSPFDMDCVGKNGAFVGAKTIPFHKSFATFDKALGHYFAFISALGFLFADRQGEDLYYAVGNEPSVINSKEHKAWEAIKNSKAIQLIFPEQVEIVAEKIEAKKAKKFLLQ